jgi:hypothetical protein
MKFDQYQEITLNLSKAMSFFEDWETILYGEAGEQTETGILVRFVQCYIGYVAFRLRLEFQDRFENSNGGWSLTE